MSLPNKTSKLVTAMRPAIYSLFREKDGNLKKYQYENADRKSIDIDERVMTNDIIDQIVQNEWQLCYVFIQIAIQDRSFTLSRIVLNHKIAEKLSVEATQLFYMIFCG